MRSALEPRTTATWILRIAIAVTCVGTVARWWPFDSPVFSFLYYDHALLGEHAAALLDDALLGVLAIAGVLVLTPFARAGAIGAGCILAVLTACATAVATRRAGLVPLEDAVRFLAPFALAAGIGRRGLLRTERLPLVVALLAGASAATFLGHGLAAWYRDPRFVDLLIAADRRLLGVDIPQSTAESILGVIAGVDVAVAAFLLMLHSRTAAAWMAFWGLATASTRILHAGLGHWPEVALRALNSGAPLALLYLLRSRTATRPTMQEPTRARTTLIVLLLALCGCSRGVSPLPEDARLQKPGPTQWRVVWTEDPAHEALVAWSTNSAGRVHQVLIDTTPIASREPGQARVVASQKDAPYTRMNDSDGPALFYHHARIDKLTPSTTYWFVIESDGLRSPLFHFVTAPADDRPFTLLAGSDSRSDRSRRRHMNERMRALAESDPDTLALLHGGDYVYDGANFGLFSEWLTDQSMLVTGDGRILPIIPTRGNHEGVGKLFDEAFGWPGGGLGRNWFACRLAKDVLLLVLNTEVSTAGDQSRFVEETLSASKPIRWQLASYHQPAWPSVKLPSSALIDFVPLFERHHVDLVVESDGHTLKRTVPIRDGKQDPTGVVYIGEGGLGVAQRTPDSTRWFLQPPGFTRSAFHVWSLHIAPDAIRMRAVLENGDIADDSTLRPRERG